MFTYEQCFKMQDTILTLCNPDKSLISILPAYQKHITLRFNDLSELTLRVSRDYVDYTGTIRKDPSYDLVQTRRLIKVENLGWFVISSATEMVESDSPYKDVVASSYQSIFKDRGFSTENRVYTFYDESAYLDTAYNDAESGAVPTVVGQLHQQLGISVDIHDDDEYVPSVPYGDWTITYVSPKLNYVKTDENAIARTMEDNLTYAYDFMVSDVEDAFGCVTMFDFYNLTIKFMMIEEVTKKTDIYLSSDNIVSSMKVAENASEITTVLSCNGIDIDIRSVNPTGTNYICDFSYYMDESTHQWMSDALITKLKSWQSLVTEKQPAYSQLVLDLREQYMIQAQANSDIVYVNTKIRDLSTARDKYLQSVVDQTTLNGIIVAEAVVAGEVCLDPSSTYSSIPFEEDTTIEASASRPTMQDGICTITGGVTATAKEHFEAGRFYFIDGDIHTYCVIGGKSIVDAEQGTTTYTVSGFTRYATYSASGMWLAIYESRANALNAQLASTQAVCSAKETAMKNISDELNIVNYFNNTPSLLAELKSYWIEGDYESENISVTDSSTPAEIIGLALDLLDEGYRRLARVCQPRFSFSLDCGNFLFAKEFAPFTEQMALGSVVTVEKREGLWYYPSLLEMSFDLDDPSTSLSLSFGNSLRLDDWGYTYNDLIKESTSAARKVAANWNDVMKYAKKEDDIYDLLMNPLDATLRSANANMSGQSFVIDDTGILGRRNDGSGFEDEQIRLMNNVILYTDDNWKSCRSAFGKISYQNDAGEMVQGYGLIGDAIIGDLFVGQKLRIQNHNNTVIIDDGLTMKDANGNTVFRFNPDDGSLKITGEINATSGSIGGCSIFDGVLNITEANISGTINVNKIEAMDASIQAITSDFIEATTLTANNLKVYAANMLGTVTFSQLPSEAAKKSDISATIDALLADSSSTLATGITTIVGGVVTTDYINTLGISVKGANITGVLSVGNVFSADLTNGTVTIGGMTVGTDGFEGAGWSIGSGGISFGDSAGINDNTTISATGALFANNPTFVSPSLQGSVSISSGRESDSLSVGIPAAFSSGVTASSVSTDGGVDLDTLSDTVNRMDSATTIALANLENRIAALEAGGGGGHVHTWTECIGRESIITALVASGFHDESDASSIADACDWQNYAYLVCEECGEIEQGDSI